MKRSLGRNPIVGVTPVWVVGTYDKEGRPNLMTVAWGGICSSDPFSVGISLRKATYTYEALMEGEVFTVSIPSMHHVKETDYVGIASGRDKDKWEAAGLTPVRSDVVPAPYVAEFPLVLECKLVHTLELGLHTRFIGEVLDVKAEESVVGKDGSIDIETMEPFVYVPRKRTYYGLGPYLGKAHSMGAKLRRREK